MTAVAVPASAQVWDFTGNGLLNGTYVFREAIYVAGTDGTTLNRAIVDYGTITFNGSGKYTLSASEIDTSAGSRTYTQSGTYSISASGYGFMTHPYGTSVGSLHGMVSPNGVFIGSSTEAGINDFMIAVPASSATNATFSGNYTLDYFNLGTVNGNLSGAQTATYDSIAQLTSNGNGNIGTVSVKTYLGDASKTQPVNQSEGAVTYNFASGVGTVKFPTTTNLAIQGDKLMYISPDGNLIFGGSKTGYDFFVGVRRASGTPPRMDGLYYSAGLDDVPGEVSTFNGAFTVRDTVMLDHQRFLSTGYGYPLNYTAVRVLPNDAWSDFTDTLSKVDYTLSQDASIRIGVGQSPFVGLRIAVRGPSFSISSAPSSAPYLFPTGVTNSASSAPFTAGVAPGELLTIYGANLATSFVAMQGGIPFPTILGGVRVLMNNRPAAIYYVSPGQVAAIVPYGTTEGVVQIQIERNGVLSNTVTEFRYLTSPGIFSQSQTGAGPGAILHADYSPVTEDKPAVPGEAIQVFLTGIGAVFPTIADGALGGATAGNLNMTLPGAVGADVYNFADTFPADVTYAGLAPGFAGLYQVNLTVPDGAGAGSRLLDISTSDAYTSQVAIWMGPATASSDTVVPRKAEERPFVRRR